MWGETTVHEGGWGESSFATEQTVDTKTQRLADRMPYPVSVEKLVNSSCADDKYHVGKMGFSMIVVIGRVESVTEEPSGAAFNIILADPEQSECTINCQILRSMSTDSSQGIAEGTLLMVLGKIRSHDADHSILVIKSREVVDKEYDCFKYDVIIAENYHGKKVADAIRSNEIGDRLAGSMAAPYLASKRDKENIGVGSGRSASSSRVQPERSLTSAKTQNTNAKPRERIVEFLRQECPSTADNGVHLEVIAQSLKMPSAEVKKHLDYLCGEGEAFQTVDNEHYAVF